MRRAKQTHMLAELVQTEVRDVNLVSEPARAASKVACKEFGGKDDGRGRQSETESVGIVRVVKSEEGVNWRIWAEVEYRDPSEERNHCRQTEFSLKLTAVFRKLDFFPTRDILAQIPYIELGTSVRRILFPFRLDADRPAQDPPARFAHRDRVPSDDKNGGKERDVDSLIGGAKSSE